MKERYIARRGKAMWAMGRKQYGVPRPVLSGRARCGTQRLAPQGVAHLGLAKVGAKRGKYWVN